MPAPADGHHEQLKLALVAAVAQIVGPSGNYHLGPTRAFSTHAYKKVHFSQEEQPLWHSVRAGLLLLERETGCDDENIAEFFVLAAARYQPGETEKEWLIEAADVPYTKLQNRLLDDLQHAIENGPERAGNPLHANIFATDGRPIADRLLITDVNRDFMAIGWCCLELRLEVTYHTPARMGTQ